MIITPQVQQKLEARTLPAEQVREMVRDYLARTQLNIPQLAHRINYSKSVLQRFLAGKLDSWQASDVNIRVALTEYMAAHPIGVATETTGQIYETENVRRMRLLFANCLRDRAMAFCYGAPGSQKTWVLSHLVAEHNRLEVPKNGHGSRAYIIYSSVETSPRQQLRKMARAMGIIPGGSIQDSILNLRWEIGNRRTLFVLDEAQHLPIETLEIVRELNDCEPHCGILLAGSHRLAELFRQRAAELEQWNSRLAAGVKLPGMTEPEAIGIIAAELGKLPVEKVNGILDASRVADAYHDGPRMKSQKIYTYISARRLFHQLEGIKSHPLFVAPAQPQGATA